MHAALAVGDRVVELLHDGRPVALEALDDGELPERSRTIERVGANEAGEVEQLSLSARLGECNTPDVHVDVEVRVVDPRGSADIARGGLDPLSESGHRQGGAQQASGEQRKVGCSVEQRDRAERRRELRVFLEAPHQTLGVAHLGVVNDVAHQRPG